MNLFIITSIVILIVFATSISGAEIFEVESAIIRCVKTVTEDVVGQNGNKQKIDDDDDEKVVDWKPQPLKSFHEAIHVGPHDHDSALDEELENDIDLNIVRIPNCKYQAIITVKIKQTKKGNSDDAGMLFRVDHMLDERSGKSVRIANPIAIKVLQGPVFTVYPLKFQETVNAQVHEEVINSEKSKNFKECNDQSCENDETKFGFCCSCHNVNSSENSRGGQECEIGTSIDPTRSSAHCFMKSEYWYSVFEIGFPELFHQAYIQILTTTDVDDGKIRWKEAGNLAKVNSLVDTLFQDDDNLSVHYRKIVPEIETIEDELKSSKNVILIPTLYFMDNETWDMDEKILRHEIYNKKILAVKNTSANKAPKQMKGNIEDGILIVPKTLIGGKCSQVGVTLESFKQQPNPCNEIKGTCLLNQPFDLWEIDDKGSQKNLKFKIKHFTSIHHPASFKFIKDSMYLVTENLKSESAAYFDIQLSADNFQVLRPGYNAQFLTAVSGAGPAGDKLTVEVVNQEYVPASYSVHILSCTNKLPLAKSKVQVIQALGVGTFELHAPFVSTTLHPNENALCSVGILNHYNEVVAIRMVLFTLDESCICYLTCKCECSNDQSGFSKCDRLSDDEIRSAGFQNVEEFQNAPDLLEELLDWHNLGYVIPNIILLLLILGICKGMLGKCCSRKIGNFGLCYFNSQPRKLNQYFESNYAKLDVIYDEYGNPLDPFTKKPTVRRISSNEELALNIVFFLGFPIIMIYSCCGYCLCSRKLAETTSTITIKSPASTSTIIIKSPTSNFTTPTNSRDVIDENDRDSQSLHTTTTSSTDITRSVPSWEEMAEENKINPYDSVSNMDES